MTGGGPDGGASGGEGATALGGDAPEGTKFRPAALAWGKNTLALLDQAVVSGTSFLSTVLVGRWCGAGELGVYSLGVSLLVTAACIQDALVALPYTIYRHRPLVGSPREYAGSALAHHGILAALALVVLAAAATALSWQGAVPGLAGVTWALAVVIPFALLREFGRRFAFAHLHMAHALALDVAVTAVQLAGLAWLASAGVLSASTAFLAIGAGCVLAGGGWLSLSRSRFAVRRRQVGPTLRQSWSLGKWLFASQVTLSVQGYFIPWLLAWTVGPTAAGVYVACLTVPQFSNPLMLGLANALAPRAAQAASEGGGADLRRVVFQTTLLVGTAMALFCAAVLLGGEDLLGLLFPGGQYQGHGTTVSVLTLAVLAAALGMPASNGLAAVERPQVIFKIGLVSVLLSVVLVPCLVAGWGLPGAAWGFLAGNAVGTVGRWLAFLTLVPSQGKTDARPAAVDVAARAHVTQVLEQFLPHAGAPAWVIERLSEGAQASIFVVRRPGGRPAGPSDRELVVKLYKPAALRQAGIILRQFQSLAQVHARLNDSNLGGWKVHAPEPLFQCPQPPALVMTLVPGRPLNECLERADTVPEEARESIACAVAAALVRCWSGGAWIHGDLNFDNILCDVAGRSLSFVDSGVLDEDYLCAGLPRTECPASRDLAYLLYDAAVAVKKTFAKPGARRRQQGLVERVVRAHLRTIETAAGKRALLDEIRACARAHLDRLRGAWSPRGVWRRVLRWLASRRISAILDRLGAEKVDAGAGGHPAAARQPEVHP